MLSTADAEALRVPDVSVVLDTGRAATGGPYTTRDTCLLRRACVTGSSGGSSAIKILNCAANSIRHGGSGTPHAAGSVVRSPPANASSKKHTSHCFLFRMFTSLEAARRMPEVMPPSELGMPVGQQELGLPVDEGMEVERRRAEKFVLQAEMVGCVGWSGSATARLGSKIFIVRVHGLWREFSVVEIWEYGLGVLDKKND